VNVQRRVVRTYKTRRAIRAEEEAARKEKLKEWQIDCLLSGKRDRVLEEHGIDLLAGTEWGASLPRVQSVDAGAGYQDEEVLIDTRTPSQQLGDHIRSVVNDPERQRERARLKGGGSHDAKDVPEDSPRAVSYPPVRWEEGV
jgi:hypothetical protein